MNVISNISDSSDRYARCIQTSKRVRWDIDKDVIRGRNFDIAHKFLPDGLSLADTFTTLSVDEKRLVSQIQGRTYANIFGLVERFINAKVLELSEDHWFGDQVALEALVRFSDEELKHQALFRLVDAMVGDVLPAGYRFDVDHNAVAHAVLGKSTWAVLALTLDIELFTQFHYRQSIDSDPQLSELFKDVFLFHWKEESQHAILDELEIVTALGEIRVAALAQRGGHFGDREVECPLCAHARAQNLALDGRAQRLVFDHQHVGLENRGFSATGCALFSGQHDAQLASGFRHRLVEMSELGGDGIGGNMTAHHARTACVDNQRMANGIAGRAGNAFEHLCSTARVDDRAVPSHCVIRLLRSGCRSIGRC